MKKRTLLCLAAITVSTAVFFGYLTLDRIRTDKKPPEITVGTDIPAVSVFDPHSALLAGVTAEDNRSGDVTGSLVVEKVQLSGTDGTVKVYLAAFDQAGNVAKAERTVQYSDYKSPTFSLSSPLIFSENYVYEVLNFVHAEDMLDGDISHRVRAVPTDGGSISDLGTHNVRFSVTNSLGDTAELELPVEVYPAGQYDAKLSLTDYLIYISRGSVFNARDYLKEFKSGTKTYAFAAGVPADLTLDIDGSVNTQKEGIYPVSYTVSNDYYTGFSRLIVIVEG